MVRRLALDRTFVCCYHPDKMVGSERSDYFWMVVSLLRRKLLVLASTIIFACAAGLVVILAPDKYEASVLIMPKEEAVLDEGKGLERAVGELLPGRSLVGSAEDLCLELLRSDRLLDAVIDHLPELLRLWGEIPRQTVRRRLLSSCTFEPTRAVLRITVRATDAQLSARLANAFATELQHLYRSITLDGVRQELDFLTQRLAEASKELTASEERLTQFQRNKKTIRPEESVAATFSTLTSLGSRIIEEKAKLEVLKSYASMSNPQLRLQVEKVKALKKSLSEIEQDGNPSVSNHESDHVFIPLVKLPEVGLEGVRLLRELHLRENLYLFLMERYEGLRLAAAKKSSALMVIEKARVPEVKSGPRRSLWVVLGALAGIVLGSSCALILEHLRALGSTEEGRKKLEELKRSVWRGG